MIKLEKKPSPAFLTPEKVTELTQVYKETQKAVWREDDSIKQTLLEESNNKCVYCECLVENGGAGLEVEHFLPKSTFPDLVVTWSNLLSSCRRCNTKKGSHTNKVNKEIIDPFVDNPKEHLSYRNFMFKGKTELGVKTVLKLNLNEQDKLVTPRFEVFRIAAEKLHEISEKQDLDELRNAIERILGLCQPNTGFSVVTSSIVHSHPDYASCVVKLKEADLWDECLEKLHQKSFETLLD